MYVSRADMKQFSLVFLASTCLFALFAGLGLTSIVMDGGPTWKTAIALGIQSTLAVVFGRAYTVAKGYMQSSKGKGRRRRRSDKTAPTNGLKTGDPKPDHELAE